MAQGELTFYIAQGEFIVTVNGGHLAIRGLYDKPRDAVKVSDDGNARMLMLGKLHELADMVAAYQRLNAAR